MLVVRPHHLLPLTHHSPSTIHRPPSIRHPHHQTQGFSGAEMAALCQEAAMCAMEEEVDAVHVARRHFLAALPTITPRIGPEMLQFYADFRRTSGLQSI